MIWVFRFVVSISVIFFFLSLNTNYFPSGSVFIATAVFTLVYLVAELMRTPNVRAFPHSDPDRFWFMHYMDWLGVIFFFFISFTDRESRRITLFFVLPPLVFYIMLFGAGYGLHRLASDPAIKDYTISQVDKNFIRIKNINTYRIRGVRIPASEYKTIKKARNMKAHILSEESFFGLSIDRDFKIIPEKTENP